MGSALDLYDQIFKTAQYFLEQTDEYSINILQQHDEPTYSNVAKASKTLAKILEAIAVTGGWDEERMALNARQAALFMEQMALAIEEQNQEMLDEYTKKLSGMAFL